MKGLVLIASYPKSGNTWIRAILSSFWSKGNAIDINRLGVLHCADRMHCDAALGIKCSDLTGLELSNVRPTIYRAALRRSARDIHYKVHDAWLPTLPGGLIPFQKEQIKKVIYMVRDPRDVAVSFANHCGRSLTATIQRMNNRNDMLARDGTSLGAQIPQLLSSWSEHVRSWLEVGDIDRLVLRFEDLLEHTDENLRLISEFLEMPVDESVILSTLHATKFDVLKSQEDTAGFREKPPLSKAFFHSGKANGWKDRMTREQAAHIETDHAIMMKRLGYLET